MPRTAYVAMFTVALMFAWVWPATAELMQPEGLESSDLIETLAITVHVGTDGEPLAEPVGLDLGLGFPLWLYPLGTEQKGNLPIGAVPQEGPEQAALQPGESATFVFRREGDPGADTLRRTPQLLDNVRVSDIARLGFISRGTSNWELAGYELVINGKRFAAREDVQQRAKETVEQVQSRWMETREALDTYAQERGNLQSLNDAGLATEEDMARLETILAEVRPLEKAAAWQQGVSLGVLPWFVETGLKVPGREESGEMVEARVIVTTAPHSNGETYNHMYFRTGGRKFFLYPPANHFTPDANPQMFELSLETGPLATGDVRGFALGMLAHDRPYATVPDRWHPERLVVEFGGRVVYDSESEPIDRRSLQAIRLIPPAHVDGDGQVVLNEPNPRECFVWHAGQAQGLDLDNGGTAEIPGGTTNVAPEPTPTGSDGTATTSADADEDGQSAWGDDTETLVPDDCWPGESPEDPADDWTADEPSDIDDSGDVDGDGAGGDEWDYPECYGDDPSSAGTSDDWDAGYGGEWGGGSDGTGGSGTPWNGISGGAMGDFLQEGTGGSAWELLAAQLAELVARLLEALGPPLNNAPPFGEPPQIENVHLLRNFEDPCSFQVVWSVSGDASQIADYQVSLLHIQPEIEGLDIVDVTPTTQAPVPAVPGVSEYATDFLPATGVDNPAAYVWAAVVARLNDGSETSSYSEALPWIPPQADADNQPQPVRYGIMATPSPTMALEEKSQIGDVEPEAGRHGVWSPVVLSSTRSVNLAATPPTDTTPGVTSNVAVRGTNDGTASVTIDYLVPQQLDRTRRYELIGHIGYLEESVSGASAHVDVHCTLSPLGGSAGGTAQPADVLLASLDVSSLDPPSLLRAPLDLSVFEPGDGLLHITIAIPRGNNDAAAPLAIYGLRLVPVDQ